MVQIVRVFCEEETSIEYYEYSGSYDNIIEVDTNKSIKDILNGFFEIDDKYINENFDGNVYDCWSCELCEDKILIKGFDIQNLINEDFDFNTTIEEVLKMIEK